MNERIHACLDGTLPREEITAAERRELAAYERAIRASVDLLPHEDGPDLTAPVMERIAAAPAPWETPEGAAPAAHAVLPGDPAPAAAVRESGERDGATVASLLGWLWRPRQVTLRPGYALAAAALLAAVLMVPRGDDPVRAVPVQQGGTAVAASAAPGPVRVHFRLDAPEARSVSLAGDFTDWEPNLTLVQEVPGVWTVEVPLEPGVHEYAFVVDGAWVMDPMAEQVDDGFGGTNSRVAVVQRGAAL